MPEDDLKNAFLSVIEIKQAREQKRTHLADRGADRVTLLAIEIPEDHRIVRVGIVIHAKFLGATFEFIRVLELGATRHSDPRKIALHIGHEYRNPIGREAFRQALQSDSLAGPGRSRDQAMTVGTRQRQMLVFAVAAEAEKNVTHRNRIPSSLNFISLSV